MTHPMNPDDTTPPPHPEKKPTSVEDKLAALNRTMPFSAEAETGVLSCVIQDPEKLAECRISLATDAFYHPPHRVIYSHLLEMMDGGQPIDPMTLTHILRDRGVLEKIGGAAFISELFTAIPSASHLAFYRSILDQKLLVRQLIHACAEGIFRAQQHGMDATDDADAMVAACQESIIALTQKRDAEGTKAWQQILDGVVDELDAAFSNKGHIPLNRVATGFTSLDRRTGGLEGGQLVIIAGRPSMGKTSLAMNIVEHVSLGEGDYSQFNHPQLPVLVFSLEMSGHSLGRRSIVGGAGVNLQQVKFGLGSKDKGMLRGDQTRIAERVAKTRKAKIYVVEKPGISIQEARSRARVMKARFGIRLVVVDYLQLMTSTSQKAKGNRSVEIGEIANGLKNMAKELDIPVIALAQLSRKAEERKGAVPQMSDLREGGDIEQAADIIAFVHRPWYYDHDHPDPTEAKLILAKGRDIGIGEVPLEFIDNITQFNSLTDSLLSNDPEKQDAGYQAKQKPSSGKVNYADPNYKGPRGRPRKDSSPPLDEIFPD